MIADIREGIEIIRNIHAWIKNILHERKSKQEKHDAQLFGKSASLLISLRALDNGIHHVLGKLILFDPDWSRDERTAVLNEIVDFAGREEIVTTVRDSLRDLDHLMREENAKGERLTIEDDRELLTYIFEYGAKILRELSGSPVTPFPDRDALRDFIGRIKQAKDEESRKNVVETSEKVMNLLERTYREEEVFPKLLALKHQMMKRHKWLQKDIDW